MSHYYPLLLTGTINSALYQNTGNKITDISVRLRQYEDTIERYITDTAFNPIVFAENSNFNFDERKYLELAKNYNKDFEFISTPPTFITQSGTVNLTAKLS